MIATASRRLVDHPRFHRVVLALIVANAAFMGLEAWPAVSVRHRGVLDTFETAIQTLFVLEIALRLAACGRRLTAFFRDGWNVFDAGVVLLSLLPVAGPTAMVARLARVLRAARLVSVSPGLRLIVATMLRSITSMGHVLALLALLLYIYGIMGHHLFGAADPAHWGSLARSMETLFIIITLEGWVEIMRAGGQVTAWAWAYYASFIVLAVFVVINLFIAVVITNLGGARREQEPRGSPPPPSRRRSPFRADGRCAGPATVAALDSGRDTRSFPAPPAAARTRRGVRAPRGDRARPRRPATRRTRLT
jgi:voltage-gated sodium channel